MTAEEERNKGELGSCSLKSTAWKAGTRPRSGVEEDVGKGIGGWERCGLPRDLEEKERLRCPGAGGREQLVGPSGWPEASRIALPVPPPGGRTRERGGWTLLRSSLRARGSHVHPGDPGSARPGFMRRLLEVEEEEAALRRAAKARTLPGRRCPRALGPVFPSPPACLHPCL